MGGENFSEGVADGEAAATCDNVGGGEYDAVGRDEATCADAAALIVLNLDEGAGKICGEISDGHAIGAEHGGEGAGGGVAELARLFEGGFGLVEFALMEEATAEDALNFGIFGGDSECVAGGLFGFGVATSEIEGAGFEFTGLGIIFVPPEGLAGGEEGSIISSWGPKFGLLSEGSGTEKKEEEKVRSEVHGKAFRPMGFRGGRVGTGVV